MTEKQKIAYDAFMAGVDWTLRAVIQCGDVFDMTEKDAELFRIRARKIVTASAQRISTAQGL